MLRRALMTALLCIPLTGALPAAEAGDTTAEAPSRAAQIQWFGTWEAAKAEAKRTGRPILLTAAACNCAGISGMW